MNVNELLNKLFRGLGEESLKLELMGILGDLADEDPSNPKVQRIVNQVCQSIVVLLSRHGRAYDVSKCVDDVTKALMETRARRIARAMAEELRKIREAVKEELSGGPLPT